MVKMGKKFRFKYHPKYFGNPALQHFNGKLEALVYDETAPDVEDTTLPDAAEHDAKIANLIPLIQEMFGQVSIIISFISEIGRGIETVLFCFSGYWK